MTIIVLKNMFDEDFWRRKEFLLSNSCSSWKQDQWYIITGYWLHFGSMHELFLFDLFSSWQASSAEEADPLVRLALWSHEQIKKTIIAQRNGSLYHIGCVNSACLNRSDQLLTASSWMLTGLNILFLFMLFNQKNKLN